MFGGTRGAKDKLPQWLQTLLDGPAPEPWRWVEPSDRVETLARATANDDEEVRRYTKPLEKPAKKRVKRSVIVGRGAQLLDRMGGGEYAESYLVFDPQSPDSLQMTVGFLPSIFWVPAGQGRETIDDVTRFYHRSRGDERADLTQSLRLYAGWPQDILYNVYTGEGFGEREVMDNEDVVFEYGKQLMLNVATENMHWGSAYLDDPFDDTITGSAIALAPMLREAMDQDDGEVVSVSVRTRWSRSIITLESHYGCIMVFDVAYQPVAHPAPLASTDKRLRDCFPPDVPVDVAAALGDARYMSIADIEEVIATSKGDEQGDYVCILGCMKHRDPGCDDELARYSTHDNRSVRKQVANLALRRGNVELLRRMADTDADPEIRQALEDLLERRDE